MAQVSVLQIIGLFLFIIIGACLFALQSEKYEQYRWHLFGTCIAAFIGTGIVGYLAFVPTPHTPPPIIIDSYGEGKGGGGGGGSSGQGSGKKKGGSGGGQAGTSSAGGESGGGGGGGGGSNAANASKDTFRDCADCPKMVTIPAGRNVMGASEGETDRPDSERPQVQVTIAEDFAVSENEISVGQFMAFADDTGFQSSGACNTDGVGGAKANFQAPGMQQDSSHPVVCVSFDDALRYTKWLSDKTGKKYNLLSETEWEYVRRGPQSSPEREDEDGGNIKASTWIAQTTPGGSYRSNAFKVYDMMGNAAEWTADCWHDTHAGHPGTSAVRKASLVCGERAVRGGSWDDKLKNARHTSRRRVADGTRDWRIGFRVRTAAEKDDGENN